MYIVKELVDISNEQINCLKQREYKQSICN